MPKFIVQRPEIHIQRIEIEADSLEEAAKKVYDEEGEEVGEAEFASTIEPYETHWYVTRKDNKTGDEKQDSLDWHGSGLDVEE